MSRMIARGGPKRVTVSCSLGNTASAFSVGTFQEAQGPLAPAREGYQQGTPAILAGSINMKRPAAAGRHRRTQRGRRGLVERFEVGQKTLAQFANLAAGERNAMFLCEIRAYFLPLAMVNEALEPDVDHDVVADGALGRNKIRQRC